MIHCQWEISVGVRTIFCKTAKWLECSWQIIIFDEMFAVTSHVLCLETHSTINKADAYFTHGWKNVKSGQDPQEHNPLFHCATTLFKFKSSVVKYKLLPPRYVLKRYVCTMFSSPHFIYYSTTNIVFARPEGYFPRRGVPMFMSWQLHMLESKPKPIKAQSSMTSLCIEHVFIAETPHMRHIYMLF